MNECLARSHLVENNSRTSLNGLSREATGGTEFKGEETSEGGSSAAGGLLGESKTCREMVREVLEVRVLLFE